MSSTLSVARHRRCSMPFALRLAPLLLAAAPLVAQDAPAAHDALGDPLPAGAIARLGTQRLRHPTEVMGVAYTVDGSQLWSVDIQGGLRLWDAGTGALVRSLAVGNPPVRGLSLSTDGVRLAINREGAGATVIDTTSGAVLLDLEPFGGRAVLSLDGRWLAAWGPPYSKVELLRAADGAPQHELNEDVTDFAAVAFSTDGDRVALAGRRALSEVRDNTGVLAVRDTGTGEVIGRVELPHCIPQDVAFSPDGHALALCDDRGVVHLFDARTLERLATGEAFEVPARSVSWSPDASRLAVAAPAHPWPEDFSLGFEGFHVCDGTTAAVVLDVPGHLASVAQVSFSPDGKRIASACRDFRVRLWDAATGARAVPLPGHESGVAGVVASSDGRLLFTAGDDGKVGAWDARKGTGAFPQRATHSMLSVACSPDGRLAACGSLDGSVRVWRTDSDAAAGGWNGDAAHCAQSLAFSPDGSTLVSAESDGKLRVRDVATVLAAVPGAEASAPIPVLHELASGGSVAFATAFSPDGRTIAGASSRLRIFDADSGEMVHDIKGTSPIAAIAFSPDGSLVATADADRSARVYDAATGKLQGKLADHAGRVKAVAFARDGRTLATAGEGSSVVRLWDVATLAPAGELDGHADVLRSLTAVGHDALASASSDGTVLVWRVPVPAAPGG